MAARPVFGPRDSRGTAAPPSRHVTAVQTVVYRLESKGSVRRVKRIGNANVFDAVVSQKVARGRIVDAFLEPFGGDMVAVVAQLIALRRLSRRDLQHAKADATRSRMARVRVRATGA
jgi:BlaI family penicillinase repressor